MTDEDAQSQVDIPLATAALDLVENMILITDPAGTILYVNPAFSATTGYEPHEAIGATPSLLRSGVQGDDFYTALWTQILAGSAWSGELVNRRKNGELYTDRMTITPLVADDGAITHFVAVKRDVSGHLAALTAGNPAGIAHVDQRGGLVYANERLMGMLGKGFEHLLGDGWLAVLGSAAPTVNASLATLDGDQPATCIVEVDDGRSFRVGLAPLRLGPDTAAGAVATFEDVTTERETLRRLAEREALVRSVLASMITPTAVVDRHGVITEVNPAWLEMDHLPAGHMRAVQRGDDYRSVWRLAAAVDDPDVDDLVEQAREVIAAFDAVLSGRQRSASVDYHLDGDIPRWWEVRVTGLDHSDGGAVVIHTDITWRRQVQSQLERQARIDMLTGLANRVGLLEFGERALARSRRTGIPVTVTFIDLDGFMAINDTHGHPAGDAVLIECAQRLRAAVRADDEVARVGGDEFVLVAQDLAASDLVELEQRVADLLTQPIDIGAPVTVGVSMGSVRTESDGEFAELIAQADALMYRHKQSKPQARTPRTGWERSERS